MGLIPSREIVLVGSGQMKSDARNTLLLKCVCCMPGEVRKLSAEFGVYKSFLSEHQIGGILRVFQMAEGRRTILPELSMVMKKFIQVHEIKRLIVVACYSCSIDREAHLPAKFDLSIADWKKRVFGAVGVMRDWTPMHKGPQVELDVYTIHRNVDDNQILERLPKNFGKASPAESNSHSLSV